MTFEIFRKILVWGFLASLFTQSLAFAGTCELKPSSRFLGRWNVCQKETPNVSPRLITRCIERLAHLFKEELSETCKIEFGPKIQDNITNKVATFLSSSTSQQDVKQAVSVIDSWAFQFGETFTKGSSQEKGRNEDIAEMLLPLFSTLLEKLNDSHTNASDVNSNFSSYMNRIGELFVAVQEQSLQNHLTSSLLLGKYLELLSEKVFFVAEVHDLACLTGPCSSIEESEIFQTISLFRSFLNKNQLREALSSAESVDQRILSVFDSVSTNFSFLESLQNNAQTHDSFDSEIIQRLEQFANTANVMLDSAKQTGLFRRESAYEFELNFSLNSQSSFLAHLQRLREDLYRKLVEFENKEDSAEQAKISSLGISQAALAANIKSHETKLKKLLNELEKTRLGINQDSEQQSKRLSYLEEIKANGSKLFGSKNAVLKEDFFQVKTSDAIYQGTSVSFDKLLIPNLMIESEDGTIGRQLVHLEVDGSWSPTCALQKSSYKTPQNALIGPEGYQIAYVDHTSHSSSTSNAENDIKFSESSNSKDNCHGVRGSMGFSFPFGVGGVSAEASATNCSRRSFGKRNEKVTSNVESDVHSQDSRAVFSAGLRLEDTPLPQLPAGSLIAAVVDKDDDNFIHRLEVIQRHSSIILNDSERIRFLVNDCYGALTAQDGGLVVRAKWIVPQNARALSLLTHSLEIVDKLAGRQEKILELTLLTDDHATQLRNEAYRDLISKLDFDINELPLAKELFFGWVDDEIEQIRRKLRLRDLVTQIAIGDSDLTSLQASYQSQTKQKVALISLATRKILGLEGNGLWHRAKDFVSLMARTFGPTMKLWAPKIHEDLTTERQLLKSIGVMSSKQEMIRSIILFTEQLGYQLTFLYEFSRDSAEQSHNVLIDIPNAFELEEDPCSILGMNLADPLQVAGIWREYRESSTFKITIRPQNVYRDGYSWGGLHCQQRAPIIEQMVLGVVYADDDGIGDRYINSLNSLHPTVIVNAGRSFIIPSDKGPYSMTARENSRVSSAVPVVFSSKSNAHSIASVSRSLSSSSQAAYGLPLFGEFEFKGIDKLRAKIVSDPNSVKISNFVLLIKVRASTSSSPLSWIDGCE